FKRIEQQVRARSNDPASPWSIECDLRPVDDPVLTTATAAANALRDIRTPMLMLSRYLRQRLEDEYDDLGTDLRGRLDSLSRGLERRADITLAAWISMLSELSNSIIPAKAGIQSESRVSGDMNHMRADARN